MHTGAKLLILQSYALLLCVYVFVYVRSQNPGLRRLVLAIPHIICCLLFPLILDPFAPAEAMLITPLGGIFSLAAFKLLAFCMGRGPLTLPLNAVQLGAILMVPIIPARVFAVSGGSKMAGDPRTAGRSTLQLTKDYFKGMGGAIVVCCLLLYYPTLPWFPRHWLYTLCSCLFLGAVFDILAAAATLVLQVPVAPAFNEPWLSDSFADFWARRWNLATTYTMRVMIYEPIMEGRFVAPDPDATSKHTLGRALPQGAAAVQSLQCAVEDVAHPSSLQERKINKRSSRIHRFVALQATFMISGVWHILVFAYNTHQISYRWALFFIIQAPIVMLESILVKVWRSKGLPLLPQPARVLLTNAALIVVAGPLFFGPADETGFVQRNITAAAPLLQWLAGWAGLQGASQAANRGGTAMNESGY